MRKIICLTVIILLCCCACQTQKEQVSAPDETQNEKVDVQKSEPKNNLLYKPIDDVSIYDLRDADGRVITLASKTEFDSDYSFEWNGQKITIKKPAFTGIKFEKVYSYKANYQFNADGYESINTSFGYFTVDKQGNVFDYDGYSSIKHDDNPYYIGYSDGQHSDNTMVIQTGEPGNFKQRLYSLDKKPLSDYFDYISYFYNGLALVQLNGKIGIIDESGSVLVNPIIPVDSIEYPLPEPKENKKGFFVPFITNDAFIIPIGGEMAVISIVREAK